MKTFDAVGAVIVVFTVVMILILGAAFRELSIRNDCDEQNSFRVADQVYDCVKREAE